MSMFNLFQKSTFKLVNKGNKEFRRLLIISFLLILLPFQNFFPLIKPVQAAILDTADLWFKADTITGLSDGDLVTSWSDSSSSGLDLTQGSSAAQPIYKTNIVNSKPVIRFDGNDDVLTTLSTAAAAGITVFTVVKSADTSSGYLMNLGGNNNSIISGFGGSIWEYFANPRTTIGNISTSEFQIITSRVGSSATGVVSLGSDPGTAAPWAGDVAEVLIYKSVLSDTDYNTVHDYLNVKYFAVTVPGAPTSLSASPGSNQMGLTWAAPASDGGASITDYLVEYKLASSGIWLTFADGTSTNTTATVTGLTDGLSYDFRVSATNSIGTGAVSSTATDTPTLSVPGAPTSLSASPGSNQMGLTWAAPASDGGASITDYLVEYKLASSGIWLTFADGTSTNTTATVTGLTDGLSYDFRVSATNSIGTGAVSSTATDIPASILLQDDFTGTTIDTSKWTEFDPGGSGGTSGNVQQDGSLSVFSSDVGGEGTFSLDSIDSFSSSTLEISAVISDGGSSILGYGDRVWSAAGNKAYFIYKAGSSILALAWSDSALVNNVSCGTYTNGATYKMKLISTGFEVYKDNVLQCTNSPGVANLVDDKPVFLQSNGSAATNFDDVYVTGIYIPPTAPAAPTIGTATADNAQASIIFSANSTGGSPITSYTVTSNPGNITASDTSSPIVVTGLTNSTAYTFTVTATNAIGTSDASAASNEVTPDVPSVPDQVTGVSVTGVNKQVLVAWGVPGNGGSVITDYLIEYKASDVSTWTTFVDGTSSALKAIVTGLTNSTEYDFRVSAINSAGAGTASTVVTSTPLAISELVIVINGESNSGGQANNSEATAEELASISEVQILNNTSFVFENLDIGTNNNIDHCCWLYSATDHGFELQLANSTKAHSFPDNSQVHLIKTGQGGSRLSQWNVGGNYWTKFLQRTAAAKTQLTDNKQYVVWLSIGINDYIAGTTEATFKTELIDHIDKIKVDLPGTIVILTQFQSMSANSGYPTYNTVMDEVAASEANVYVVDSTGADLDDGNHWSYDGLKTVTDRMVTITKNKLGLIYPGTPTSLSATPGSHQASLVWVAPVSNGGESISDYFIEYKTAVASIWSTFVDGVSTTVSAIVTSLSDGVEYNFRVSGINSNGVGNSMAISTSTTDGTNPVISDLVAISATTTVAITWTTDEESSSIINYGLTGSYSTSTPETDTLTRVTSHSVALSNLLACTTYHYRVRSLDLAQNEAISSHNTFRTLGCTGSAAIEEIESGTVATSTGAIINLNSGTANLSLNIPSNFSSTTDSNVEFQLNQLNGATVILATGNPDGGSVVGEHIYELSAMEDVDTIIDNFDEDLTITITYTNSEIDGLDETTLLIYYWTGSAWSVLDNCSVDISANTVSCTTTHFTTFGVFGSASASSSGGGGYTPPPSQGNGQSDIHIGMNQARESFVVDSQNINLLMYINSQLNFNLKDIGHKLKVIDLDMLNSQAELELDNTIFKLSPSEFETFDLDNNGTNDLKLTFNLLTTNRLDLTLTNLETNEASLGTLVKEFSSPVVYWLVDGVKKVILNAQVFLAHNFKWSDIKEFTNLDQYTDGEVLDYPQSNLSNGSIVKEKNNSKVYLIENNKKRHIFDEITFTSLKLSWNDIKEVDDLSMYTLGGVLKEITAEVKGVKEINISSFFNQGLSLGMRDSSDVERLQELLASQSDIYPEAIVSGYFGPLTEQAVQKFQLKYSIVSSSNDIGFGYVGPQTRAKLAEVF